MSENESREELGFVDLGVILLRRKWLVVLPLLLAVGASFGYISRIPKRYEGVMVLRIGRTRVSSEAKAPAKRQDMLLERADVLAARIRVEYGPSSNLSKRFEGASISSVLFDKDADEIVHILARGSDPDTTAQFLDEVGNEVLKAHQQLIDPERNRIRNRLLQLEKNVVEIQGELNDQKAATDESALALARATLLDRRLKCEQEIDLLKQQLFELEVIPTSVLLPAQPNPNPVEPKYWFTIMLFTLGGSLLGICIAFATEFMVSVSQRMRMIP